jgi:hypothetical protein
MSTDRKDSQQLTAAAALKEQRARDGAQALREYAAERAAIQARTARLRALRLAKEAADAELAKSAAPAKGRTKSS